MLVAGSIPGQNIFEKEKGGPQKIPTKKKNVYPFFSNTPLGLPGLLNDYKYLLRGDVIENDDDQDDEISYTELESQPSSLEMRCLSVAFLCTNASHTLTPHNTPTKQ